MVQEGEWERGIVELSQLSTFELVDEVSDVCIAMLVGELLHKVSRQELMLVNFFH